MGFSISCGVSAIPDTGGWLILPGDMPMVRSDTMLEVARELADHAGGIRAAQGVRGHPVGFSAELYSNWRRCAAIEGAAPPVARYPHRRRGGRPRRADRRRHRGRSRRHAARPAGRHPCRSSGCEAAVSALRRASMRRAGRSPFDLAVADAAFAQAGGRLQQVLQRAAVAAARVAQDLEHRRRG